MNPNLMECDDHKLKLLLAADEQTIEHDSWTQHVEHCSHCQTRLRELAAQADDWQKAVEVLASDDDDALYFGHDHNAPSSWNESMVKQLLEAPSHPEMLGRLGRYEMERMIGCGGMGIVFKAFDTELNRVVAVKLLAPYLASRGSARKRFAREARAAAGVRDDHVVPIFNVESENEPPFLVMQYVAGGSLQEKLDRDGPLEVAEVLRIGLQTAKGLAAAHAQGLIHRDVKPSNILLDEGVERALLTDFGLARAEDEACLTRSGFHPGTPHYMSPEQVRGEVIDGRSDLFSLGCVLYALCTGHSPFRADTSYAVMRRITDESPRPIRQQKANIAEWLEAIVMKLLSKSRDDRFKSAKEVAELLEDCLAHVQQPTVKTLPATLTKQIKPRSHSAIPARSIQGLRRHGIRTWLFKGVGIIVITLIAMMLKTNLTQRRGQVESGPLTAAQANLSELLQQLKAREESIRQISFQGTARQYARQEIQRANTETVDEFVARCVGLAPVYDDVPPYTLSASRDFNGGMYRFTMGDINAAIPKAIKYMDWFIHDNHYVQLMGREPGACEAEITNNRDDIRDDREASLVRLDIAAFRPVKDYLMSEVVMNATSVPGIPDVGGRPLWKLERLDNNKIGWKATFMFQQPIANPLGAKHLLWCRVYWENIGGELVIVRVDKLTVDGDENSTPQSVTLIDDYRSVCGKPIPFRVRSFGFGDRFVNGAELLVSDVRVNDYVDVTDQIQIPAGSRVRNRITGTTFLQPASEKSDISTEADQIQGTWNVIVMQQIGHVPTDEERAFYNNGGYKITITKDKMIHSPDHSSMQYRLNTTQLPHVFDYLKDGKVVARAIYELNGDELKFCLGRTPLDGSEPKTPKSFDIDKAPVGEFPTFLKLQRTKAIEPVAINPAIETGLQVGTLHEADVDEARIRKDPETGVIQIRGKKSEVDKAVDAINQKNFGPDSSNYKVNEDDAPKRIAPELETPIKTPDWIVAWDFQYPLLNQRYAMMRILRDGTLVAQFPEWPLLRTQLPPVELADLVKLMTESQQSKPQSLTKAAGYASHVKQAPALINAIKVSNVRLETAGVIHEGTLFEIDLNRKESQLFKTQLWKMVGLAAIGGSNNLPQLVDLANRELKRKFPDLARQIDPSLFQFAHLNHTSGDLSIWFNFNVDSASKKGQTVLHVGRDGKASIEQVSGVDVQKPSAEQLPGGGLPTELEPSVKRSASRDGSENALPTKLEPLNRSPKPLSASTEKGAIPADGPPQRKGLPDDIYRECGESLAEQTRKLPPWGAEKSGLNAGIRIIGETRVGGQAKAELWVYNSGADDVRFSQISRTDIGLVVIAKDERGKEYHADITAFDAYPVFDHLLLPAGLMVKVKEFAVQFNAQKNTELDWNFVGFHLPRGEYKLFANWSDSQAYFAHEGDWTGELITGEVEFKLE